MLLFASTARTSRAKDDPAETWLNGIDTTSWLAGDAVTWKILVFTAGKPPPVNDRKVSPARLNVRPEKVATPLTAATVSVPPSVAPAGGATVTLPLKEESTVPKLSSAL